MCGGVCECVRATRCRRRRRRLRPAVRRRYVWRGGGFFTAPFRPPDDTGFSLTGRRFVVDRAARRMAPVRCGSGAPVTRDGRSKVPTESASCQVRCVRLCACALVCVSVARKTEIHVCAVCVCCWKSSTQKNWVRQPADRHRRAFAAKRRTPLSTGGRAARVAVSRWAEGRW